MLIEYQLQAADISDIATEKTLETEGPPADVLLERRTSSSAAWLKGGKELRDTADHFRTRN